MEFQIEWLLVLPLFFGLGWLAAQWEARSRQKDSKRLPKSYFKGLNHLIEQEPDKAIEALIEVAQVDTGTVDLYFALGQLFTQRGEIERSIRVYQSLIERVDLADAPRHSATLKLGAAFLSGGLFDRAQACFVQLLDTPLAYEARIQLLHIYQSQQEWLQAIEMARALNQTDGHEGSQNVALSHFGCELAKQAMHVKDWPQASAYIDMALNERPESIRAGILRGQWYAAQGQPQQAIEHWQHLVEQQPSAMPLVAHELYQAFAAHNEHGRGLDYLFAQAMQTGSIDVAQAWIKGYIQQGEPLTYSTKIDALFAAHPSFYTLNQLLNARIQDEADDCEQTRTRATLVRSLIQNQVKQFSRYRCAHCGFEATHYYWQCPACTRWETYPAKRLEELTPQNRSRNNPNNY